MAIRGCIPVPQNLGGHASSVEEFQLLRGDHVRLELCASLAIGLPVPLTGIAFRLKPIRSDSCPIRLRQTETPILARIGAQFCLAQVRLCPHPITHTFFSGVRDPARRPISLLHRTRLVSAVQPLHADLFAVSPTDSGLRRELPRLTAPTSQASECGYATRPNRAMASVAFAEIAASAMPSLGPYGGIATMVQLEKPARGLNELRSTQGKMQGRERIRQLGCG
jgi:hypothetical protein